MNNRRKLILALSGASATAVWKKPLITSVAIPVHAEMTLTEPTIYALCDTGPGGGIVFYITDGGLHGLEAATSDQSSGAPWGCDGTLTGAASEAIGAGSANTDTILNAICNTDGDAANVAREYTEGGFSDWFLPSKDELNEMYQVLASVSPPKGGFGAFYWSSSQSSTNHAWEQNFITGFQFGGLLGNSVPKVRAVRAF